MLPALRRSWRGSAIACAVCLCLFPALGSRGEDPPGEPPGAAEARQQPGRTGLPLPRFVSFRAPKVNLRTGPGIRFPIDWVYERRDLPVEIIDEFDTWRRIRDWQGTMGWVHQSMLQGRRTILVTGARRLLRREPGDRAEGVAWLEPGVIGGLDRCERDWCLVEVERFEGWLRRGDFYGADPPGPAD